MNVPLFIQSFLVAALITAVVYAVTRRLLKNKADLLPGGPLCWAVLLAIV